MIENLISDRGLLTSGPKATISLCLIAGNVEDYIERCLQSFAPIADEICIVRAIGNQKPDRTIEIARSTAQRLNVSTFRFAEYKNRLTHRLWPHLDDFAAARQMSFDLASGDFLFWADTDDILESGADLIKEHAGRNGYSAFIFPYHIFGRGLMVPRERMMRKNSGRWLYPVHECFDFNDKPAKAAEDNRVVIKHLPHASKTGSNERNLRILKAVPESKMTTGLLYHYHVELALAGDIAGSCAVAEKVLARPDLGKAERFELFMNLARAAQQERKFDIEKTLLHQAHSADPCRREALALLCNNAMNTFQPEAALAYARQMAATPSPKFIEWNDRAAIYGWVGDDLHAQALRMNGLHDQAEALRLSALKKAGGPTISLIHATRGRFQQAAKCRKTWLDLAANPGAIEHIFIMDADDPDAEILSRFHSFTIDPGGGCVAAWNHGALASSGAILVQLSDDWTPPPMWDKLIIERLGGSLNPSTNQPLNFDAIKEPKVLAISDGHRKDDLLCMAIFTRAYLELDWFMFHPDFTGVYSDNFFTDLAYKRDVIVDAKDLVFTHHHPAFASSAVAAGVSPAIDRTYLEQNAPSRYAEGKAIYNRLVSTSKLLNPSTYGTPADWSSVPGWFNYWFFYKAIANTLQDGDLMAEIGVWMGRSLIYMAQTLQRLGRSGVSLIAVDTFQGEKDQPEHESAVAAAVSAANPTGSIRPQFEANIKRCGVADMIEVREGDSVQQAQGVPNGSLAFCFIDAAHDYQSVKADIAAWSKKVRPGGTIAGHDAQWPEVRRAVLEAFPKASFVGPIWFFRVS